MLGAICSPCCVDCSEKKIMYRRDSRTALATETGDRPGLSVDEGCSRSDTFCRNNGDCCSSSFSGYVYSPRFPAICVEGKTAKAYIVFALLDNTGTIGGVGETEVSGQCPSRFGVVRGVLVTAESTADGDGFVKLRIPFTAQNDASCGPVGLTEAEITWSLETPGSPLP